MPCRLVLPHPSHPPLIPIPQGGPPSPFFAKQNEQFGCPFRHGYPPRRPPIRHASARRGRLFRSQTLARWMAGSSPAMTIESRGTPSPRFSEVRMGTLRPTYHQEGEGQQNPKNNRQRIIDAEQGVTRCWSLHPPRLARSPSCASRGRTKGDEGESHGTNRKASL